MADRKSKLPERGSDSKLRGEVRDYVVTLREEALAPEGLPVGRARLSQVDQINRRFQSRLRARLRKQGLEAQVVGIGPPLGIAPMVTLSCTPRVSEVLREMPEVKDVILDAHTMGLVR